MAFDNSFTAVTGATYTAAQYNTYVRDNLDALFAKIEGLYPIGAIIELYVSTNPATLFGFGTWEAYGAGRVTVGINAADADFDAVGETGGEKAHALTEAENGYHGHNFTITGNGVSSVDSGSLAVLSAIGATTYGSAASGSGAAHNNLQPYIVVYRWRRTA